MPTNILNLPAYTVTNIEKTEHDYHINAETKTTSQKYPHYRIWIPEIYSYDRKHLSRVKTINRKEP